MVGGGGENDDVEGIKAFFCRYRYEEPTLKLSPAKISSMQSEIGSQMI